MMQIGQGYCISQHFSSVCWSAVAIYWDTSGEQVTADKSKFCENEFCENNSISKLLRYKEETCPDRSVGEQICP